MAARTSSADVDITAVFLPVVFGVAIQALTAAVDEHEPDIVLCVGEAGGRSATTPERFALTLDAPPSLSLDTIADAVAIAVTTSVLRSAGGPTT